MKGKIFTVVLAVIMMIVGFTTQTSAQQSRWQPPFTVPEFVNYNQSWAGYTQYDRFGQPYITYNPKIMERFGAPWYMYVWLRAHEYGHVNRIPFGDMTEGGADCWAAQQLAKADPEILKQVIYYMDNVQGNLGADAAHGTGHQQAAYVRQCAGW